MAQLLSNLPIKSLVRDPNTKYLGTAIVWKIAAQNFESYPANSTTLITNKILTAHMFDGKEVNNTDNDCRKYGNNRWRYANIRQWLNKSDLSWYVSQHSADTPPSVQFTGSGKGFDYDNEAGFMTGLSGDFINNLLDTTYSMEIASVDGGGTESLTDKIFLASAQEVGIEYPFNKKLPLFSRDMKEPRCYFTPEGVSWYNAEAIKVGYNTITENTCFVWFLRNIFSSSDSYRVGCIGTEGNRTAMSSYINGGVRPLCNLNSSILVSDIPDENGVYDIEFPIDNAPHISGSDINQGNIYGGFKYDYSVNYKGDDSTIMAIECLDGTQIRSYEVTLRQVNQFMMSRESWLELSYGKHTATIIVTDTENQSETRTITFTKNQAAPTITGNDGSHGEIAESFTYKYTVNDLNSVDGDTVTVVEKLDDVQQRSYTVTLGTQETFIIPAEDWSSIDYGNHTVVITATDSHGLTATRTRTFVKRNYKPAISGGNTDLGTKTTEFWYSYTVYDDSFAAGGRVKVVERLNDIIHRTYMLETQTTEKFIISDETFLRLSNKINTLSITATDEQGESSTRMVTFTKQQDISLMLEQAILNDINKTARPSEATLALGVYIPTGSILSVEICNNGFDENPKWEDCTREALKGENYLFKNADKTSEKWGVNMRVIIKRNTATETPFINGLSLKLKY